MSEVEGRGARPTVSVRAADRSRCGAHRGVVVAVEATRPYARGGGVSGVTTREIRIPETSRTQSRPAACVIVVWRSRSATFVAHDVMARQQSGATGVSHRCFRAHRLRRAHDDGRPAGDRMSAQRPARARHVCRTRGRCSRRQEVEQKQRRDDADEPIEDRHVRWQIPPGRCALPLRTPSATPESAATAVWETREHIPWRGELHGPFNEQSMTAHDWSAVGY